MFLSLISILFMPFITIASKDMQMFGVIDSAVIEIRKRVKNSVENDNETQVCYEDIGCLTANGPFKHIGLLPDALDKINTRFFVYNRFSSKNSSELDPKLPQSLSLVIPNQTLAIIIHGFMMDANNTELLALKDSLINFANISTVVVVDWSAGAAFPRYLEASTNTQVVGRQIASLVNTLGVKGRCNPYDVHLIGFSLGAHIAGFAGKYSQLQYKWKFGRISALDAAWPLFEGYAGAHLTNNDAEFVDAIHTSAGTDVLRGELGFVGDIGHIDFYPHNGTHQPRCASQWFKITCNHYSSIFYYESSLNNTSCQFTAYQCPNWTQFTENKCTNNGDSRMGYDCIGEKGRGVYYLNITDRYPFCDY